jgi:NAD-dependent deacetylase
MKIVALTGAGISKQSGIDTFEEQGNSFRDKLSVSYMKSNRDEFNKIIVGMREQVSKAKPNDAHKALSDYGIPVITMNIDGLHNNIAFDGDTAFELHGNISEKYNVIAEDGRPCPYITLYGEPPMTKALIASKQMIYNKTPDILLVIGVSGYTNTGHEIIAHAVTCGAMISHINEDAIVKVRAFLEDTFAKK